jgi:hypothetical protein
LLPRLRLGAANLAQAPARFEVGASAVTRALEEFVARRKQKNLRELMGRLEWDKAYDYKAQRSR